MKRSTLILPALGLLASLAVTDAEITLKVVNANPAYTNENTYIRFESEPANLSATIGGAPVVPKISYSITQVGEGIKLGMNRGGRIFLSLGKPLNDSTPPEANNPSIPSYKVRFDKVELTYDPNDPNSVANLTTIDFFGLPISLKTYKNGQLVKSLGFGVNGATMIKKLSALTQDNPKVVLKDGVDFLRILGPSNDAAAALYPSMKAYVDSVKQTGKPLLIADQYSRNGDTPATKTQKYNFTGAFSANGDLLFTGGGDVIGQGHIITLGYEDLVKGIYTCNPKYKVDGADANIGQNDVYSAVVRDALAGFDLGFAGSQTLDPATGKTFAESPSNTWWSSHKAFGFLQPNNPYYDQWAQYVAENSDSYSFPFSDRWQTVQISLAGIDTLEITVLPDGTAQ